MLLFSNNSFSTTVCMTNLVALAVRFLHGRLFLLADQLENGDNMIPIFYNIDFYDKLFSPFPSPTGP